MIEKRCEENSTEHFEEVISDEKKVAETFNNFFVNIVPNLTNHNHNTDFQKTDDPVLNAINKYKHHSSIVMIKSKIDPEKRLSFSPVQYEVFL